MKYVLDACALISLLRNEQGALLVRQALEADDSVCLIHAVNLCEVYYDCLRSYDTEATDRLLDNLLACGVLLRNDMDVEFWKAAGRLKSRGRIALADCFAVTLAAREEAVLLTSDRHKFEPLLAIPGFSVNIRFIR